MKINIEEALSKFAKGAVIGAGSAIFAVSLPLTPLATIGEYKKLGIALIIAGVAGAMHGIWNVGKQMFFSKSN